MYVWVLPLIVSFALLLPGLLQAQSTLVGSATATGNCVQLTPDWLDQTGAVWMDRQLNLNYSFTVDAQIYLGVDVFISNGSYWSGADGMTFALQQSGCNALGWAGGNLGFTNIGTPSLAVEYDTYLNADFGDPDNGDGNFVDHVGITYNGSVNHFTNGLAGPVNVGQLEDGAWHNTVISWDANTQTLSVTLDGNPVTSYTGDLVGGIFGGNSYVTWGFTAATGGEVNVQSVCVNNISFPCNNNDNSNKVTICHRGNTLCVSENAVAAHLAHGDYVGACAPTCGTGERNLVDTHHDVYPNPATSELNINLEAFAGLPAQVSIFNNLGQLVWEKNFETVETDVLNIKLAAFSEGFHFVTVQSNGELSTTKVTIQK